MSSSIELLLKYFPDLTSEQKNHFSKLEALYAHWNAQINVISRKDSDHFIERHVLHSLGIAKAMQFTDGSKILDIGTGGGFPGIPLAILFPNCHFLLVDSIGKKIKVVNEIVQELGLKNVETRHERAEKIPEKFDFIVSRAVTAMPDFLKWTKGKFRVSKNNALPNGILYLKGGDLTQELKGITYKMEIFELSAYYEEEFFETKKVVYIKGN